MNKTANINLNGRAFIIDEDAYRLLDDYLRTLAHAFGGTENEEIVPDIEARISEVFEMQVENGKPIITLSDVEAVITRIGHPEDFVEETVVTDNGSETVIEETVETVPPPPLNMTRPQKRLFRDSRNGMIGGVCAGLAEYLNVDVTWVRLAAVALCFISLSTLFILYLILWAILPDAVTPYQRMQLTGESPTLQNIGQSVKNFFKSNSTPQANNNFNDTSSNQGVADGLAEFFGVIGKVLLIIILIICIPIEIALAIGLIGAIIALIALSTSAGAVLALDFTPFTDVSLLVFLTMCSIGLILVIGIPLFIFIRLLLNKNSAQMKNSTKVAALISWILAIILTGVSLVLIFATNHTALYHVLYYFNL